MEAMQAKPVAGFGNGHRLRAGGHVLMMLAKAAKLDLEGPPP
jgi:hypothetical protein